MDVAELAEILQELERHPRIADFALGELRVSFRDAAPAPDEAVAAESEGEPENHELPEGVWDPRKAIERVYAKHRAPKVEAG